MNIDIERLRKELMDEATGAYFAGEFGAALIEVSDINSITPEELVNMAQNKGIDLRIYQI